MTTHYHAPLARQLQRYLGDVDKLPEPWERLLAAISDAYTDADGTRRMLERAIELSSNELFHANAELRGVLKALPDLLFRLDADGRIFELTEHNEGQPQLPVRAADEACVNEATLPPAATAVDAVPVSIARLFWLAAREVRATRSVVCFEYSDRVGVDDRFFEVRLL